MLCAGWITAALKTLTPTGNGVGRISILELSAREVIVKPWIFLIQVNTPTSMAQDEETNEIYLTEIFTGRVMKVTN